MKTVQLQSKTAMPILGIGTWQLTGSTCTASIKEALRHGYTHIDTAEAYGNEEQIGKALDEMQINRNNLFITSKLWMSHYGYQDTIDACNASLAKLGTKYLDLYLMHWPDSSRDMKETVSAMKDLYDDGKIRAFGVSNFTIPHLKRAIEVSKDIGIPISVNQVEFHPGLYQEKLMTFCQDNDIVLEAYSPLTRGDIILDDTIQTIADNHAKTPAQVALRWMVQKDVVVIPKASSKDHIKENMEIFDFELTSDEMHTIDRLGDANRLINPPFAEFDVADAS